MYSKVGTYKVTYTATDSLGKTSRRTVHLYVSDMNPYSAMIHRVRFISWKYMYTLNDLSVWKLDDAYKQALDDTLNPNKKKEEHPDFTYTFNRDSDITKQ